MYALVLDCRPVSLSFSLPLSSCFRDEVPCRTRSPVSISTPNTPGKVYRFEPPSLLARSLSHHPIITCYSAASITHSQIILINDRFGTASRIALIISRHSEFKTYHQFLHVLNNLIWHSQAEVLLLITVYTPESINESRTENR